MKLTLIQSGTAACILDALSNKEIARAMDCSVLAATRRVEFLMHLLDARNRVHLALILKDMA